MNFWIRVHRINPERNSKRQSCREGCEEEYVTTKREAAVLAKWQ